MLLIPWAQRLLTFMSGSPRAFWCSGDNNIKNPFAASRDQIHHRFRLCCDSFFTWIFLRSFRHHFRTIDRTEMADVEQTQKMIPFITWSVCLRVGFWCQRIWFGFWGPNWFSRITNQEQLCGFWETCLIVGLLPFIINFITASLSSKNRQFEEIKSTLSKSSITLWDCFRFWMLWGVERTSRLFTNGSTLSSWLWFVFPRTATIRSHKSSAGIPSNLNPASKEMIFWFCCTVRNWSLFLTNPNDRNTRMTSKNALRSTWRRFWILKISCEVGVLKQSQSALIGSVFPHDNTVCIHMYDECRRSNDIIVCHMLLSIFVIDRANVFTDHGISGLPIRAKYKHFRTIWEHTFENSPTDLNSSLKWWSSMRGVDTL